MSYSNITSSIPFNPSTGVSTFPLTVAQQHTISMLPVKTGHEKIDQRGNVVSR